MRNTKKFSTLLTNNIKKTLPTKTDEELEIINYGLETIIMNFYKIIIIIGLAFFLDITNLVLIAMFISGSLRFFTSGVHAQNWYVCLAMSIFNFIIVVLVSQIIIIPLYIMIIIMFTSLILITIYSPADTKAKPLVNKSTRKLYKILSLSYAIILFSVSQLFFTRVLMNITVISIFLVSLYITPLLYIILGQSYANYKNYSHETNSNTV